MLDAPKVIVLDDRQRGRWPAQTKSFLLTMVGAAVCSISTPLYGPGLKKQGLLPLCKPAIGVKRLSGSNASSLTSKGAAMAETNATGATSGLSDNAAGTLAYLTIIPAIIFLLIEPFNKNSFVRFHSFQCIFLCVAAIAIDIALGILFAIVAFMMPLMALAGIFLWWLIALFWLGVVVFCMINAYQGKRFMLPFIGAFAAKQAGA
jgi:uncharacterized membrane protein